MPFDRYHRLPATRRSALIEAAAEEFSREGYDGASLNRILARGGLSKGSYYFYFVDKADLFATALEELIRGMLSRLEPIEASKLTRANYWRALERLVEAWTSIVLETPHVLGLARALRPEHRTNPRFAALLTDLEGIHRTFIAAGQRLGCVRTDLELDQLMALAGAIDTALDNPAFGGPPLLDAAGIARHAALALDTFRRLLVPTKTGRRNGRPDRAATRRRRGNAGRARAKRPV